MEQAPLCNDGGRVVGHAEVTFEPTSVGFGLFPIHGPETRITLSHG